VHSAHIVHTVHTVHTSARLHRAPLQLTQSQGSLGQTSLGLASHLVSPKSQGTTCPHGWHLGPKGYISHILCPVSRIQRPASRVLRPPSQIQMVSGPGPHDTKSHSGDWGPDRGPANCPHKEMSSVLLSQWNIQGTVVIGRNNGYCHHNEISRVLPSQ
jgi:hypothetical protein